jgi:acyl-CoA thioesterase-1
MKSLFAILFAAAQVVTMPAFAANSRMIVILGSSTAAGGGASSYSASWAGLLTSTLATRGYTVKNMSISATSTADSLSRFDHDVTPYSPGFVILATSILNERSGSPAQTYVQNTLALTRRVRGIGAIPILVPPYPNDRFSASMYSAIQEIYTTLAIRGIPMFDFLDGADDGNGHWVAGLSADGTHPNNLGHRLLFDSIPLGLFDAFLYPPPPVNPRGYGSWIQNSDLDTRGDIEIWPDYPMGSWTVSFWTLPSDATSERTLVDVNGGWVQLRRTGSALLLWNGGGNVAGVSVSDAPAFHHVALTYQSITGTLRFYLDGILQAQVNPTDTAPVMVVAVGGDPSDAARNAAGDSFADITLYRAPLSPADIDAVYRGQLPWKSVQAWLPLAYAPDQPRLNLAASSVTTLVHGSWAWSDKFPRFTWVGRPGQSRRGFPWPTPPTSRDSVSQRAR